MSAQSCVALSEGANELEPTVTRRALQPREDRDLRQTIPTEKKNGPRNGSVSLTRSDRVASNTIGGEDDVVDE